MLSVTLYEFKKRENSTKRPDSTVTQRTHNAVLKMPTSLLRPEITFDFGLKGNPSYYNYAYISDLGNRYYFIRDWTVGDGHLWTAHLEVDVLASWKNSIGESTQYVQRSSKTFDGGVIDVLYPTKQPPSVNVYEKATPWKTSLATGTYVLGIVNSEDGGVGAAHYYALTQTEMNSFLSYMLGNVDYLGSITEISSELLKVLFNPMQYIVSCVWYPFAVEGTAIKSIPMGWWSIPVSGKKVVATIHYETVEFAIPKHPQSTRGAYLNQAPYTQASLFFPGVGWIALNPSLLTTATLTAQCAVDMVANQARLALSSGEGVFSLNFAELGVPIQLAQLASNTIPAIGEVANSVASLFSGKGSIASTIFSTIGAATDMAFPDVSKMNTNGSIVSLAYSCKLRMIFYLLVDEDNEDLGRPLCQKKVLSSIPGYQLIENADLSIAGTSEENRMVKGYLEAGYFYE